MKQFFLLLIILGFISCSDGSSSSLKGSSWYRTTTTNTYDFTYTINFTTENEITYTHKGWGMVGNKKQDIDDTKNGTYVYYPETQEGWINCSAFSGGKLVFSISENKLSSKTSSLVYTKK